MKKNYYGQLVSTINMVMKQITDECYVASCQSHCAVLSVPAADAMIMPLGPKAHCDTESASVSCNISHLCAINILLC